MQTTLGLTDSKIKFELILDDLAIYSIKHHPLTALWCTVAHKMRLLGFSTILSYFHWSEIIQG
jgi:hypothetical protein